MMMTTAAAKARASTRTKATTIKNPESGHSRLLKGVNAQSIGTFFMGDACRRIEVAWCQYQPHLRMTAMKAIWNGAVIAQSNDTVVVEGNHYFPETSLNRDYITFSNHHTMCSWKGQASYYSLLVNGEMNTDAAWYYPEPKPEAENIKGHVAFWKGVKVEL
jgi:uncharacterized protein (DUF427 family)